MDSRFHDVVPRLVDPDANHGDEHGRDDGDEGRDCQVRHVLQRARKRADEGDDEANDAEDDGAGTVFGDCVHHDAEGEDVGAHDKDDEEHLGDAEDLAPDRTKQDHARVGHIVDLRVGELELADDIASVCRQDTETQDEDDAAGSCQFRNTSEEKPDGLRNEADFCQHGWE
ncbi:MAG: hypothetical protein LQ346_006185 [Caloplaca aetnensis]|nr:MAG: hypothetical protein LQ346_006185 [Caloplaca aetnensis]